MILFIAFLITFATLSFMCVHSWLIWRDEKAWYEEKQRILREWEERQQNQEEEN